MIDILQRTLGNRVILATDLMPPVSPGYHVAGGVMRSEDGTIAGSAVHLDQSVRNYMAYTELPFARAVEAATNAPAKLLGYENDLGRIGRGLRADLSFWDNEYRVIGTMVGGKMVYGDCLSRAAAQAS
ncbi:MAG: amidohydrolase family protein, partial [Candidatus Eremiobacteraeota bacterium]|nr:amidohydrolase family protein [Candidatus Eremiobacteraeota bacterium]